MFQAAYAKKMSMRLLFLCSITMLVTFMLSTQAVSGLGPKKWRLRSWELAQR
jgi:hypothetical protein